MKLHLHQTARVSRPSCRPARGQLGFSLVEMLAALVMLGLALGALYQAASGATRNARVSAEYAIATTLAESELDAFVISRPDVGVTQRGRYGDYEWERWVERFRNASNRVLAGCALWSAGPVRVSRAPSV